jgi:hypothetical protein
MSSFAKAMAAAVKRPDGRAGRSLEEYFDGLEDAIVTLSGRVKELEAAQPMTFKGTWSSSGEYARGDVVVHGGQPWHCNPRSGTSSRPGSSDDWTLLSKVEPSKAGARSLSIGSRPGSRGTGTPR